MSRSIANTTRKRMQKGEKQNSVNTTWPLPSKDRTSAWPMSNQTLTPLRLPCRESV